MNGQELVFVLVLLILGFGMLKRRMDYRNAWEQPPADDKGETLRLRQEVQELKERIKVLERITVDKENSLAKEIESLRDH